MTVGFATSTARHPAIALAYAAGTGVASHAQQGDPARLLHMNAVVDRAAPCAARAPPACRDCYSDDALSQPRVARPSHDSKEVYQASRRVRYMTA
jgi:hypothetical protein